MASDDLNLKVKFTIDTGSFKEVDDAIRKINERAGKISVSGTGGSQAQPSKAAREPTRDKHAEIESYKKSYRETKDALRGIIREQDSAKKIDPVYRELKNSLNDINNDIRRGRAMGEDVSSDKGKQQAYKEEVEKGRQILATKEQVRETGFLNTLTKKWRQSITGVLIDLHMLRVIGQSSKVVSAMFDVLSKSIGYVVDMVLLPALPYIIRIGSLIRELGHWFADLNPVTKRVIGVAVLLVGGFFVMLNTVKSVIASLWWFKTTLDTISRSSVGKAAAEKVAGGGGIAGAATFGAAGVAGVLATIGLGTLYMKMAKAAGWDKIDPTFSKAVEQSPFGMFASGGLLKSGQAAVVGEKGPELLIPGSGGYNVVPNNGLRFLAEGTGDGILSTLLDSIGGLGDWLGTEIKNVMDGVGGFVGGIFSKSISGGGVDTGVGTTLGDSQKAIMSKGFATQNAISSSGFKNANTLLAAILAALMQGLKGAGGETPEVTPEPVDASSIWELIGIPIPKLASDIWNLVTKVVDVLSTKLWNLVLSPVTYVSSQLWKLVEPVAKIIPFPWTLGSLAETTVKWPWALQEPGTVTVKFPWTLAIPIVETIAFPWKLGSPTTTEVSFPWRLQEPTPDPILSTSLWILQKVLETVNSNSLWSLVLSPQSFLSSQIWSLTLPTTKEVISALDLATVEAPAAPKTFQASDLWQLLVIPQQFFSDQIWQVMLSAPLPITTDMIVDLRHIDPDEIADDWLDAFKAKKPQFNLAGEPGSDAIIIIERKSFWGDAMEIPVPYAVSSDVLFPLTPVPKTSEDLYPVTNVAKTTDDLITVTPVTKLADALFTITTAVVTASALFSIAPITKLASELFGITMVPKTSEELYPLASVAKLATDLFTIINVSKLASDLFTIQQVVRLSSDLFGITKEDTSSSNLFNIIQSPVDASTIFNVNQSPLNAGDMFQVFPAPKNADDLYTTETVTADANKFYTIEKIMVNALSWFTTEVKDVTADFFYNLSPVAKGASEFFTVLPEPKTASDFYPVSPDKKFASQLFDVLQVPIAATALFTVVAVDVFSNALFNILPVPKTASEIFPLTPTPENAGEIFPIVPSPVSGGEIFPVTPSNKEGNDLFTVIASTISASAMFTILAVAKTALELFQVIPSPKTSEELFPITPVVKTSSELFTITTVVKMATELFVIQPVTKLASELFSIASVVKNGVEFFTPQPTPTSGSQLVTPQPTPTPGSQLATPTPTPSAGGNFFSIIQTTKNASDIFSVLAQSVGWDMFFQLIPVGKTGDDFYKLTTKEVLASALFSIIGSSLVASSIFSVAASSLAGGAAFSIIPTSKNGIDFFNINGSGAELHNELVSKFPGIATQFESTMKKAITAVNSTTGQSYNVQTLTVPADQTSSYVNPTSGSTTTTSPVTTTPSASNPVVTMGATQGTNLNYTSAQWSAMDANARQQLVNSGQVYTVGGVQYKNGSVYDPSKYGGGSGGGGSGGDSSPVTISNPVVTTTPAGGYNWLAYDGGKKYGMTRTPDGDDASLVEITTEQFKNQILERANTPVYSNKSGTGNNLNAWPKSVIFPYSTSVLANKPTKKLFFLQTERIGGIISNDKVAAYPSGSNWTLNLQQQPYLNEWVDYKLWKTIANSDLSNLMGGTASERIPGLALGGRAISAGLAWVGERGRELMALPKGAEVMPHTPSMDLLAKQTKPQVVDKSVHYNFDGAVFQVSGKDERQLFENFMRLMERESRRVK